MANSTQEVVSDGTLVLLDISFEYLDRTEITVYFDSVLTTSWAWVGTTDRQITFDPAVPAGVTVLVKRTTDLSELWHKFSQGAAFTAESLDEDLLQVLHIAQEATEANFGGDFYGPINMHLNRITQVADAINPQDVPTFAQLQPYAAAAASSAAAAATSAASAAASALDAATYTVAAHMADALDAHAASAITNTPAGNIAATTVQAALNELDSEKQTAAQVSSAVAAHTGDAADAHAASAITNTPAGNISSTTVQGALNELDSEKQTAAQVSSAIASAALPAATASVSGYMTSTYAAKLDGIAAGANVGVAVDAGVYGLGQIALMGLPTAAGTTDVASGATVDGSKLRYAVGSPSGMANGGGAAGTWKNVSSSTAVRDYFNTFQRIA